ncbi:hypothetical protein FNV43_RR00486 [Rhamnella rubrinervis]|uniref:Uncharacterized protein n=1 Tax=Rhamnella rubrinervis TaxID=2594499 RepID=A0A8K0HP91_9ROSA|nr:hypothetical protein FNV43_RR00486 [Rhamnella rubrinervis]
MTVPPSPCNYGWTWSTRTHSGYALVNIDDCTRHDSVKEKGVHHLLQSSSGRLLVGSCAVEAVGNLDRACKVPCQVPNMPLNFSIYGIQRMSNAMLGMMYVA